jgi:hypothetical protein
LRPCSSRPSSSTKRSKMREMPGKPASTTIVRRSSSP